ncbi:MAG: hypothetical protein KC912_26845 [Proteobacteria bacterium]|nr:hypothetical protein [Pseudomonadota bacterium]
MRETPASRRWRKIVAEQVESGQSVRAFAQSRNLKPGTLAWWKSRLRKIDREASTETVSPEFTALTVVEPVGTVVLALEDHKAHVVVDHQTDLGLLRRVLEAMA